jgi:hypothetical protein
MTPRCFLGMVEVVARKICKFLAHRKLFWGLVEFFAKKGLIFDIYLILTVVGHLKIIQILNNRYF